MKVLIGVAIAGAVGALLRFGVTLLVGQRFFPWATLSVNVVGSFLMGVAYVVIVEKAIIHPDLKPVIMAGGLGALTTFSAFSLEVWAFIEKGALSYALLYIFSSVLLSITALWLGIVISRYCLA